MLTEGINTAVEAGAVAANVLARGDCAYGNGKVIAAAVKTGARFSFTMARNPAVDAAIATISDEQYIPVHYPGAVIDPDTGQLISDARVAEVPYTAFAGTRYQITARLIVRRILDANTQDPLFPVWRHHPFLTTNTEPVAQADITHRRHTICETVRSDLIDEPWAHQPSGWFPANAAWAILAAICHKPAPRRRHPDRHSPLRRRARRDPTHPFDRRPGPTGPTATPTGAAPTHTLAAGSRLAHPLDRGPHPIAPTPPQHKHRPAPPTRHDHIVKQLSTLDTEARRPATPHHQQRSTTG